MYAIAELNMLIIKEFLLLAFVTLVTVSVHAGHKRIIIKVPQRTRHIYHHHVKKVPVYVILPETKPKVIVDLEKTVKTTRSPPCKEASPTYDHEDSLPPYRFARFSDREKDTYQPDWIEDRRNKGAFAADDDVGYKTLEPEFRPPPASLLSEDLDGGKRAYAYGRVQDSSKRRTKHVTRAPTPTASPYRDERNDVAAIGDGHGLYSSVRAAVENEKSYDPWPSNVRYESVPLSVAEDDGSSYASSYQYRISHRIDDLSAINR